MLLVDSSVWVDVESGGVDMVALSEEDQLSICPAILHELRRGVNTPAQYEFLRDVLLTLEILDSPTPLQRFEEAAQLYVRCRAAGYTMSGFDCLIAASAITHSVELVHADQDFDHIARVEPRLRARRL